MPFLDPIKLIPAWVWLIAVAALCLGCELHGRSVEKEKLESKENKAALVVMEQAKEKEKILNGKIVSIVENNYREQQNAQVKIDSLVSDVRTGKQRLSVAVSSCSPAGDSATPAGTVTEARAELLPTTAIDLIELAAGADAEVRRTNECIDSYNAVRNELNGASIKN